MKFNLAKHTGLFFFSFENMHLLAEREKKQTGFSGISG